MTSAHTTALRMLYSIRNGAEEKTPLRSKADKIIIEYKHHYCKELKREFEEQI